eukprot:TRINITY_DN87_c0_g3_i3.p1 TRINITY_DN87_c0_g3~~TRINITY_DN87_c0_g3_i3.p1  ORF type:complete len:249 (-),score=50.61 TRINITY_DN87_c0_g3_i3:58-804(-)
MLAPTRLFSFARAKPAITNRPLFFSRNMGTSQVFNSRFSPSLLATRSPVKTFTPKKHSSNSVVLRYLEEEQEIFDNKDNKETRENETKELNLLTEQLGFKYNFTLEGVTFEKTVDGELVSVNYPVVDEEINPPPPEEEQTEEEQQEDPNQSLFQVSVKKAKNPAHELLFECALEGDTVSIMSIKISDGKTTTWQPLSELDENGITVLHDFLASKGVSTDFPRMVSLSRTLWGDHNYERWLKAFKNFVK